MCKGGGYASFLDKGKITALFQEADNRGIKHHHSLDKALKEHKDKWMDHVYNEVMEDMYIWGND
jgi:hypothetical protein